MAMEHRGFVLGVDFLKRAANVSDPWTTFTGSALVSFFVLLFPFLFGRLCSEG